MLRHENRMGESEGGRKGRLGVSMVDRGADPGVAGSVLVAWLHLI